MPSQKNATPCGKADNGQSSTSAAGDGRLGCRLYARNWREGQMNATPLSNPIWMVCPTDQGAGTLTAAAFVNPMNGYRDDPLDMTLVFGA